MAIAYALIDVVQKTLAAMDGDEVTTYNETTESLQVANNAELTYNDIIMKGDIPKQYRLFSLTETSSSSPIKMTIPSSYETMDWLKYKRTLSDTSDGRLYWTVLKPVYFDEFLKRQDGLSTDDTNVAQMSLSLPATTLEVLYYTDRSPEYYTTFDDNTILFNSVDTSVETFLRSTKTLAYGQNSNAFVYTDSFTPTFGSDIHQIWLQETIALCQARMRQIVDTKAEKAARVNWIKTQDSFNFAGSNKRSVSMDYYPSLPNYSRK